MDNISNIESLDGEGCQQSDLPAMTSDTPMSDSEPQEPATPAYGIVEAPPGCIHHWMIGPPEFSGFAHEETTEWVCQKCGEVKTRTITLPYAEKSHYRVWDD